ncbi:MAG: hypothetical protein WB662_03680 [Methyloceanibacter sp.]
MAKYLSPFNAWPERLALTTQWARLDQGGVEDLRQWASSVREPRLAVIDTLATVRPARRNNETPYDADYRALAELHDFVGQVPGLAVLVLQHNRKAESDDPIDLISGTLGGPGVADTLLVLAKSNQGTTLYVRGRDVEERDLAVRFNKQTCRWSLMGDASDVHLSETRRKILDALHADKADSMSPKEIALATGLQKNVVDQRLPGMTESGQVVRLTRGTYAHPERAPKGPIYIA